MNVSAQLTDQARSLIPALTDCGVQAVALFGSAARGEARPGSDLDLLVVGEEPIRSREVKQRLPADLATDTLGLSYATWSRLAAPTPREWTFWSLLNTEARFLHDPRRRLRRALARMPRPTDAQLAEHVRELGCRLEEEEDLRMYARLARDIGRDPGYGQYMIDALTNLYRWGKAAAMYGNARRGVFEPRRQQALDRFAQLYPDAADAVNTLHRLYPFYRAGMKRDRQPDLPFALTDLDAAVEGLHAARDIITAAGR